MYISNPPPIFNAQNPSNYFFAWDAITLDEAKLITLGILLLAGLLGGELARKVRLPCTTGYILVGMLLGPLLFDLPKLLPVGSLLGELKIFIDIGIGLALFDLGRHLDLYWLKRDKTLFVSSIAEASVTFLLISGTLYVLGFAAINAMLIAALGISTSPAILITVIRNIRARGQITERCLNLAALNVLYSFVVLVVLLSTAYPGQDRNWLSALYPLYLLISAAVLGLTVARTIAWLASHLGQHKNFQMGLLAGMAMLTVGAAHVLHTSAMLALLMLGIFVRNNKNTLPYVGSHISSVARLFYIILFVAISASLPIKMIWTVGWIVLAFLLARIAGKFIGILIVSPFSSISLKQSLCLATTLLPISNTAVMLVYELQALYPKFADIADIVLAAIICTDFLGPILIYAALRIANEAEPIVPLQSDHSPYA